MGNVIQAKRGLEASRSGETPAAGEFIYTTDNKVVWVGDGSTAGGIRVSTYGWDWKAGTEAGFHSLGIDDNATVEVFDLVDSGITLGINNTGAFTLTKQGVVGNLSLKGGSGTSAALNLFGATHGSAPKDIQFLSNASTVLYFDQSASSWDFQTNDMITTGDMTVAGFTSTGIDDNATSLKLTIANASITSAVSIYTDQSIYSGQDDTQAGGISLYGGDNLSDTGGVSLYYLSGKWDGTYEYYRLSVLDDNFSLGTNLDTTSGFEYNAAASTWDFQTNDMITTGDINAAGNIYAANNNLTVNDQFLMGDAGATIPALFFDLNDYIQYDRTANEYSFYAGGSISASISATYLTSEKPLMLRERASADADITAYGQLWVKSATPNELWFTNDAGTDTQLGVSSGGGITWVYKTSSYTAVAGDGILCNISSGTITLPATLVVGDALIISNTHSTVLTIADAGHTIEYKGTSYTANITLAQGETVHLVAKTTAIMEIV